MRVTIYTFKGGQGKSSICLNMALTRNEYGVITNDPYPMLAKVLPEDRLLILDPDQDVPDLSEHPNIIFDLGGHVDHRAVKALEISDFVIVPVVYEALPELNAAVDSITELQEFNKNIIIVSNKTRDNDFEEFKAAFSGNYNYPIFQLKFSKSVHHLYDEKVSIKDMCAQGGLKKHNYKEISDQFDALFNHIFSSKKSLKKLG